jgi:hypothetical protein
VGIAFKVNYSFKLVIPGLILTSTNLNFGALLQYLHPYLLLPIGILGLIVIPTPIFTFTNWNFGVSLQYLHPYLP